MTEKPVFANFAQFVAAVVAASDGDVHPGLVKESRGSGLYEGHGATGGFIIPPDVTEQIWDRVYSTGRLISRCAPQPITRGTGVKIPAVDEVSRASGSRFGGVQMAWVDEDSFEASSKPELVLMKMILKKLLGVVYATNELLQDAPALAAFLQRALSLEAQFDIEDKIINGTGAGVPLGILTSGALITVAKDSAQAANTLSYNNLTTMASRLWGPSHGTALWLMSNEVFKLAMDLTTPEGSPVITSAQDGIRRILGIPIELNEYTAPLSSPGDVVLADFGQYLLAQREPETDTSIHIQFLTDESVFKFRFRTDGAPAWTSPVTPKNGTATQSPFIALGGR